MEYKKTFKKRIFFVFLSVVAILVGCEKFLTKDLDTDLTHDRVIRSYDNNRELLMSLYAHLTSAFTYTNGSKIENATDNAEFTSEGDDIQMFNKGTWNAYINPDDIWQNHYKAIQKANKFIQNVDSVNLEPYRLAQGESAKKIYETRIKEIRRWKYEARFLRAFFYFELIKRYGGVPIITQVFDLTDQNIEVERSSLKASFDFVVDELDSAARHLPLQYGDNDLGRATKGAAMALKSKVLLYAASDVYTENALANTYVHKNLISLDGDQNQRWEDAAESIKAFLDSTQGQYSLSSNYEDLFSSRAHLEKEMIFVRRNGSANNFEIQNFPIGFDLARGGTTPSQNLVDAYEMKSGAKFSWANPTMANRPFENRDPRLASTIVTNGSSFQGRIVETFFGGKDGKPKVNATKTGYYLKKFINQNLDLLKGDKSVHTWVFIRLAEIYLNYAEALNECMPGHPDIEVYINKVRQRPSVGMPPVNISGLNQQEVRKRIRHERRVELAFEGQRFWDLRRWMEAQEYLSQPLEGIEIERIGFEFKYKVVTVEDRIFESKMYFYPIPQYEINLNNSIIQNPGW